MIVVCKRVNLSFLIFTFDKVPPEDRDWSLGLLTDDILEHCPDRELELLTEMPRS